MVQNIHPLGIKTLFLPLLVLRLIVFPSCPFTALLNGKVTSKPYFPFFVISSLEVKVGVDMATKRCIKFISKNAMVYGNFVRPFLWPFNGDINITVYQLNGLKVILAGSVACHRNNCVSKSIKGKKRFRYQYTSKTF